MRYILASDYDGTLKYGSRVSDENIAAIKRFRAKGHLFGVVTGRDFLKENRELLDFIITCNGALAYDSEDNIIFSNSVDGSIKWNDTTLATALIKRCLQLTGSPCGISVSNTERYDFHPDFLDGSKQNGIIYSPLSVLDSIKEFNLINAICDTDNNAARVVAILRQEFSELLNPTQNSRCIDIPSKNIDKAFGILRLAECLGVSKDSVFAVGDNYNDLSMVKCYHGCAMSHGVDALKQAAEYTCDSVADFIKIILKL